MKKIENLLLLPFLFSLYGINRVSANLLSIGFKKDFLVIDPSTVCTWFLCYLIVLFILYKLIRMRQQFVNWIWAAGHITITSFLIVTVWWSFEFTEWPTDGFSLSQPDDLAIYTAGHRMFVYSALIFSLVQVVFWVYFTIQMVRKRQVVQQ